MLCKRSLDSFHIEPGGLSDSFRQYHGFNGLKVVALDVVDDLQRSNQTIYPQYVLTRTYKFLSMQCREETPRGERVSMGDRMN
jgi:hypothetical protein